MIMRMDSSCSAPPECHGGVEMNTAKKSSGVFNCVRRWYMFQLIVFVAQQHALSLLLLCCNGARKPRPALSMLPQQRQRAGCRVAFRTKHQMKNVCPYDTCGKQVCWRVFEFYFSLHSIIISSWKGLIIIFFFLVPWYLLLLLSTKKQNFFGNTSDRPLEYSSQSSSSVEEVTRRRKSNTWQLSSAPRFTLTSCSIK